MNSQQPLSTVALLTKNAAEYLPQLLNRLNEQKTPFIYEILVLDSGSKDDTQAIARAHGAHLHIIDPKTFNHGLTRNLAISIARGQYIAFLTQDALPVDENWLQNMVEPFSRVENLAGVFGKHLPRPDCNPLVARDINDHFQSLYHNKEKINFLSGSATDDEEPEKLRFFSNVNSCINRDFWEKLTFPEANYSEDQLWAEAVLKAGHKTLYSAKAAVYHSHSFPFREAFRRYYDEYLGLWDAFQAAPGRNLFRCLLRGLKISFKDMGYLLQEPKLNLKKKLYYLLYSPIFNLARQLAAHLAYRNRIKTNRWESALSRDKIIKNS